MLWNQTSSEEDILPNQLFINVWFLNNLKVLLFRKSTWNADQTGNAEPRTSTHKLEMRQMELFCEFP